MVKNSLLSENIVFRCTSGADKLSLSQKSLDKQEFFDKHCFVLQKKPLFFNFLIVKFW